MFFSDLFFIWDLILIGLVFPKGGSILIIMPVADILKEGVTFFNEFSWMALYNKRKDNDFSIWDIYFF